MADRAFVVALSGIPGAGKTTLMNLLLRDYPRSQAVYYDRFHPGMTEAEIQDWFRRVGDPNEFALAELIGELTRRTQAQQDNSGRPLVFFETAFGRAHRATGAFVDFQVWIDTPPDLAMARANLKFLDAVEHKPAPQAAADFIPWLKRYMTDYPMLRTAYLALSERISSTADLVVDGTQAAEASAESIRAALAARGVAP
jgi:uridine kinase